MNALLSPKRQLTRTERRAFLALVACAIAAIVAPAVLFASLIQLRSIPPDDMLQTVAGTVESVGDESRYRGRPPTWSPQGSVRVCDASGRIHAVEIRQCDDGAFPIAQLPGKSFTAIFFGTTTIGIVMDGRVCNDTEFYRRRYEADHAAAPSRIVISLAVLFASIVIARAAIRRIDWKT